MLRDAGVRTKLLAVLTIPTVLLIVVTALLVGGQVTAARRAGQVSGMADVAVQVNRVVHSLQEERSATLDYLQDPSSGPKARMVGQRQFTDQQLRSLRTLVDASPVNQMPAAVRTAVAHSTTEHAGLPSARRSIDAGRFFATETDVLYARVIRTDLDLPVVLATSATPALAQRLQAYAAISTAVEYAAHERDLVEVSLLRGTLNEATYGQTTALVTQERQALEDFQRSAPTSTYTSLENNLGKAQNYDVDQVRRGLPDLLRGVHDPDFGASVEWVGAANSRISPMTAAESSMVTDVSLLATATQLHQERQALVLVVAALLGLGLALMLAVGLARRITRPLRRLTVAAREIGAELPHMVERMQTPGEGPGVVVEPIAVESDDEIGRLAAAFNTVNEVTVAVAKEQAALRSSIAEMFVNVARRNQVLLGRQLSALDAMEAREEDPDVLDRLFTLDHLATRMRRNAESLLVLAGIDSTRRLRGVLPLSDVIRTALGEIESFDRIDLSMTEDPDVSGRHALTVAHLLAELLENATHFSNPDTRVVVSASVTGHGVDVTVTDYGLGIAEDEVDALNERIAHPPVAEIAVSQRLGLFVVGRLATRLGATVVLRRGRSAGTVVAVTLPTSVFEGLAAPEVVVPDAVESGAVDSVVAEPVDVVAEPDGAVAADVETVGNAPAQPGRRGLQRRGRRRSSAVVAASVGDASPNVELPGDLLVSDEGAPVDAELTPVTDVADVAEVVDAADVADVDEVTDGAEVLDRGHSRRVGPGSEGVDGAAPVGGPSDTAADPTPGRRGLFGRRRPATPATPDDTATDADVSADDFAGTPDDGAVAPVDTAGDTAAVVAEDNAVEVAPGHEPQPDVALWSPDGFAVEAVDEAVDEAVEETSAVESAVAPPPRQTRRSLLRRQPKPVADLTTHSEPEVEPAVEPEVESQTEVVAEPILEFEGAYASPVVEPEAVEPEVFVDEPVAEAPKPTRRGMFGRRGPAAPVAETPTDVEAPYQPEVLEPEAAAVVPEPAPVAAPVSVPEPARYAGLSLTDLARPEVAPEPEQPPVPEPVVSRVYAPAIDVLPGRGQRGGGSRFGRRRPKPAPRPEPQAPVEAAEVVEPVAVVAEPAFLPPAAPAPVASAPVVEPAAPLFAAEPEVEPVFTAAPTAVAEPEVEPVFAVATEVEPAFSFPEPEDGPVFTLADPEPEDVAPVFALAEPEPEDVAPVFALAEPEPEASPPVFELVPEPESAPVFELAPEPQVAAEPAFSFPEPTPARDEMPEDDDQSSALSELRGLYEPSFTPAVAPSDAPEQEGGLARRTPKAAPADAVASTTAAAPVRPRTAADVRGMLSGFRAGVERGREAAPEDAEPAPTDTPNS